MKKSWVMRSEKHRGRIWDSGAHSLQRFLGPGSNYEGRMTASSGKASALRAQLLQSCPTLCNPTDLRPPGSSVRGIPRQEYWSELPLPSPGDLPDPGIEPTSPALQADSSPVSHWGSPRKSIVITNKILYYYNHINISLPPLFSAVRSL